MTKLKPCPFCGDIKSLHFYNEYNQQADGYYCDDDPSEYSGVIICDATLGGCGTTSGFGETQQTAETKWNTRADSNNSEEHF